MFRAPIWMTSTSLKSSISRKSISSVTIGSPVSLFADESMSSPALPSPWKAYGEVRGLNAPPRSIVAPAAFTDFAMLTICSSLSTLHGPAMTEKFPPPNLAPPHSKTESSGWNFLFAAL